MTLFLEFNLIYFIKTKPLNLYYLFPLKKISSKFIASTIFPQFTMV